MGWGDVGCGLGESTGEIPIIKFLCRQTKRAKIHDNGIYITFNSLECYEYNSRLSNGPSFLASPYIVSGVQ